MSWFAVETQERNVKAGLVRPCSDCTVREFSVCAPLDPVEQVRVTQIMSQVEVADGSTIFGESDSADHVFNITTGAVKVYKLMPDGRRAITGFLFPGDFLGLTHRESYAYSAEAISPTKLCKFPRAKLEKLLGRKTAKERVASFLVLLSNAARRHGKPGNPVDLPMGRNDIADYLGLTIETVSRTFTQLKRDGTIQLLDGNRAKLANPEELQELAGVM